MFDDFVDKVREIYGSKDFIPLHEPCFDGNERKYVVDTIDSTFVSSVGEYVNRFEDAVARYTGAKYAVATVNGTAALHISLLLAGVGNDDEVITQSLTFVATCNAISYCAAHPVFIDVEKNTLGMSPESLAAFLEQYAEVNDKGECVNRMSRRIIRACVPMHTFGHPARLNEIKVLCEKYSITLVEDAAESLGSFYHQQHTGRIGVLAAISFNGNKIVTTGGGGMIITDDEALAKRAKHITTTAKIPHAWEFNHDQIAYNYRLPNLNAALGCAQLESLDTMLKVKRQVAQEYHQWADANSMSFVSEPEGCQSNYWLNALVLENGYELEEFLKYTNSKGVMTRPAWTPMHKLPMFSSCMSTEMKNTDWFAERLANIPSSVTRSSI